MSIKDESLSNEFQGLHVDTEKLREREWYNQGSSDFHFGFPQRKGLWLKRLDVEAESHQPAWLFLLLYLNDDNSIKEVKTSVCQVFNDGSYDELDIPFFPPDAENAYKELCSVVLDKLSKQPTKMSYYLLKWIHS